MFIYIWKDTEGIPFYVGLTKSIRRTNPKNNGNRNWLCRKKLEEIGENHVVVELQFVDSIVDGQALERKLIAEYGRIQMGTGPLTNLTSGGDGVGSPSLEHRAKLSEAMKDPSHPAHSPQARAKQRERMKDPKVRALFSGEKNAAKKPEVRAKLKAVWEDESYRAARIAERTGSTKNFTDEKRAEFAERVKANPEMKGWGERNGDPEFDAKRIAGIRAAQPARIEKMRDPIALAQRKERLKATMQTPEYLAKRSAFDTPEYRAKLSAAKKEYWAKKRMTTQSS